MEMEEEKSGESPPNAGSVHAPSQVQCQCIYMALASLWLLSFRDVLTRWTPTHTESLCEKKSSESDGSRTSSIETNHSPCL